METRNVTLTLEKAKEFYNGGNTALKEVALQAFTKEELTIPKFENIKTFEDALHALGMYRVFDPYPSNINERAYFNHIDAISKIDIIRKALNGDWKPSLVQGSVYYPYVRFYLAGQKAKEAASNNNWKLGESFKADGQKYTLVGGAYACSSFTGLANFGCEGGVVRPFLGLLGCKSKEIASHMSRYFAKEIFEATYAQHIGAYEWIDEV